MLGGQEVGPVAVAVATIFSWRSVYHDSCDPFFNFSSAEKMRRDPVPVDKKVYFSSQRWFNLHLPF